MGVVNSNPLLNGGGVKGVGQVGGLAALHHFHIFGMVGVTPVGCTRDGGYLSVFTPEVGLTNVVVVRYGNTGPVTEGFPEL